MDVVFEAGRIIIRRPLNGVLSLTEFERAINHAAQSIDELVANEGSLLTVCAGIKALKLDVDNQTSLVKAYVRDSKVFMSMKESQLSAVCNNNTP